MIKKKLIPKTGITFPSFWQWRQLPKVMSRKEKILFAIFLFSFLSTSSLLSYDFYLKNTELKPAPGGRYSEGVVGSPRFINPIYNASSDVDRDITELVFAGLFKYDSRGEIVPDMATGYELKEDGKSFEVELKENLFWHDGEKISADDVIFTINTIQNPDYKSPLRANWLGVEVEKVSDRQLRLNLKNPYPAFLERLTLKIMPKHIWQDIAPQNFPLSTYNLQPVGSGPYRVKAVKQDNSGKIISLDLTAYSKYFSKSPYIPELSFYFFDSEEKQVEWAIRNQNEPEGLSVISLKNSPLLTEKWLRQYSFSWPRYFAVFFNPKKSKLLSQKEIRQALNYAVDKKTLIEEVFSEQKSHIIAIESPILSEIFGIEPPSKIYEFAPEKASALLTKVGFEKRDNRLVKIIAGDSIEFKSDLKEGIKNEEVKTLQSCLAKDKTIYPEGEISGYFGPATKEAVIRFQNKYPEEILKPAGLEKGNGIVRQATRAKLNEFCSKPPELMPLKISLATVDDPVLKEVAENLKKQWGKLGIEINLEIYPISALGQEIIKPRNYETLLFGEILGAIPDPFPFWHSSQKKDPGLNLSYFESKEADKLLEDARITIDQGVRTKKYEDFQNILTEEAPAVFLYSPNYIYFVSEKIKDVNSGIVVDPSKRFVGVENWYIKTERIWK